MHVHRLGPEDRSALITPAMQEPALSTVMEAVEAVVTGHSAEHALPETCVASMLAQLSSDTQTMENRIRAANVLTALLCKDARQAAVFRFLTCPTRYSASWH